MKTAKWLLAEFDGRFLAFMLVFFYNVENLW